jgi:hypothetical protein
MNPSECSINDWNLYYSNSYMRHVTKGIVHVMCAEGSRLVINDRAGTRSLTRGERLECVWPQPRAINVGGHAYYIGRGAAREARRSATNHHYTIEWTSCPQRRLDISVMQALCDPQEYPSLEAAITGISDGTHQSCAISPDMIIKPTSGGRLQLSCRGLSVGYLNMVEGDYEFVPDHDGHPLTKRVQFKLQKEGILCHSRPQ